MNNCIPKINNSSNYNSNNKNNKSNNIVDLTQIKIDPKNENAIIALPNTNQIVSGVGSEPSDSSITMSECSAKNTDVSSTESPDKFEMMDLNTNIVYKLPEEKETQTIQQTKTDTFTQLKEGVIACVTSIPNITIQKENEKIISKSRDSSKKKVFYKKLSYNDVKSQLDKYYQQDIIHKYSSALDILASYLKGQKIIYMEARNHTVTHLNRLMFPAIFITAICSVLQVPLENIEMFST